MQNGFRNFGQNVTCVKYWEQLIQILKRRVFAITEKKMFFQKSMVNVFTGIRIKDVFQFLENLFQIVENSF